MVTMNSQSLTETASKLVADDKGLLAMDESNPTCPNIMQLFARCLNLCRVLRRAPVDSPPAQPQSAVDWLSGISDSCWRRVVIHHEDAMRRIHLASKCCASRLSSLCDSVSSHGNLIEIEKPCGQQGVFYPCWT